MEFTQQKALKSLLITFYEINGALSRIIYAYLRLRVLYRAAHAFLTWPAVANG